MTATPLALHHGNNLDILPTLPDCSIDSIVTDPPYELGFMGKKWDASGIAYNVGLWRQCLRVLKPGGHLLAFGGIRTYHRMACAIEDAGFEIRDSIHWLYGSGFPKSLDVSKAIDKQRYDRADVLKVTNWAADALKASGKTHADILAAFGFNAGSGMVAHWTARTIGSQPAVPTLEQVPLLLDVLGVKAENVPDDIRRLLWDLNGKKGQPGENWAKREVVGERDVPIGHSFAGPTYGGDSMNHTVPITAPATDAAKQWSGWGTALKPAHEPIVVARKPLDGTVAANVLQHGTGALNIDGCRVATGDRFGGGAKATSGFVDGYENDGWTAGSPLGRWPANLVLTHAADCADTCAPDCPVAELDRQSGNSRSQHGGGTRTTALGRMNDDGWQPKVTEMPGYGDSGGASRFFTVTDWGAFRYVAKPGKAERNAGLDGNFHPTVKPLDLMRWLVRLVTPSDGTVLDPFAGSGTTLVAARLEGFAAVGIEMTADYLPIIEGRLAWAAEQPQQLQLFTEGDAA